MSQESPGADTADWRLRSPRRREPRLLRQPGSFEDLFLVEVGPRTLDLSLTHLEDLEEAEPGRCTASSPPSVGTNGNDHEVAGGGELLKLVVALVRPHVRLRLHPLPQFVTTVDDANVRDGRQVVDFCVGMEELKPGVEIPSVQRLNAASHDFDVLLRHRLLLKAGGFQGLTPLA